MILTTFRARVRTVLRDLATSTYFEDAVLDNVLDDWITESWPSLVRRVPQFYLVHDNAFSLADTVVGTDNEQYTLPVDFRAKGQLRRRDRIDRPVVRYVDPFVIDEYRFAPTPLYNPDPSSPTTSGEVWTLYTSANFMIIPAPVSGYTYALSYYRKHTAAASGSSTIDVPEEALPLAINSVAWELLARDNDPAAEQAQGILQRSMSQWGMVTPIETRGTLPDVERWW